MCTVVPSLSQAPYAPFLCVTADPGGFLCGTCGLLLCSFWLPWSCSVCFTHALSQRLPLRLRADRFYDGARVISTDVEFHVWGGVIDTAAGEMSCFPNYQEDEYMFREALEFLVVPFRQRSWQQRSEYSVQS